MSDILRSPAHKPPPRATMAAAHPPLPLTSSAQCTPHAPLHQRASQGLALSITVVQLEQMTWPLSGSTHAVMAAANTLMSQDCKHSGNKMQCWAASRHSLATCTAILSSWRTDAAMAKREMRRCRQGRMPAGATWPGWSPSSAGSVADGHTGAAAKLASANQWPYLKRGGCPA